MRVVSALQAHLSLAKEVGEGVAHHESGKGRVTLMGAEGPSGEDFGDELRVEDRHCRSHT